MFDNQYSSGVFSGRCPRWHHYRLDQWQVDRERRSKARFAFHADVSTHGLCEIATDRQAEACSTILACGAAINLLEQFKNRLMPLSIDPDARIAN